MTLPPPPVLAVDDVDAAAAWWRDVLGFTVTFRYRRDDEPATPRTYAVVRRDDVEVHLARRAEVSDRRRSELVVTVVDVDALAAELAERGTPSTRPTAGSVAVVDLTGNRIVFRAG